MIKKEIKKIQRVVSWVITKASEKEYKKYYLLSFKFTEMFTITILAYT